MQPIAVSVIGPDAKSGGLTYIRIRQIFNQLDKKQFKVKYVDLDAGVKAVDIETPDVVVQFHPFNKGQLAVAENVRRHCKAKIITDIDDLLTEVPPWHTRYRTFSNVDTEPILMLSHHCVASTDYIAEKYRQLNRPFTIIPNTISKHRYERAEEWGEPIRGADSFNLGFIGAEYHAFNWAMIRDALRICLRRHDELKLFFQGAMIPGLDDFGHRVFHKVEHVPYTEYPALCGRLPWDMVAAPLIPCSFNDAKSDLRILDFAPFRVPVLASNRESFKRAAKLDVCRVVEDSMWLDRPQEVTMAWADALSDCIQNKSAIKELGERARNYVYSERTTEHSVSKWSRLILSVVSGETEDTKATPAGLGPDL